MKQLFKITCDTYFVSKFSGGLDNSIKSSTEIYRGIDNTMEAGVDLPEARMSFCVVGLSNGDMFLSGGIDSSATSLNTALTFASSSWNNIASMANARHNHGCAVLAQGIYD